MMIRYKESQKCQTLDKYTNPPEQLIVPEQEVPQDKTPSAVVQERRKTQKEVIMDLLLDMDAVPVKILISQGIYQYNARINELNKELAQDRKEIVSVEIDGVCCKRLEVVR